MEGKMEFKWRSEASLKAKLAPSWLQEALKRHQVGSKRRPRGSKRRPRRSKLAPRGAQELPKTLQEAPKRRPRATKQLPKCNSTANSLVKTIVFLRKIDVFAGQERSRRPVWRAKWSPSGAWRPVWRAKWSSSGARRPV